MGINWEKADDSLKKGMLALFGIDVLFASQKVRRVLLAVFLVCLIILSAFLIDYYLAYEETIEYLSISPETEEGDSVTCDKIMKGFQQSIQLDCFGKHQYEAVFNHKRIYFIYLWDNLDEHENDTLQLQALNELPSEEHPDRVADILFNSVAPPSKDRILTLNIELTSITVDVVRTRTPSVFSDEEQSTEVGWAAPFFIDSVFRENSDTIEIVLYSTIFSAPLEHQSGPKKVLVDKTILVMGRNFNTLELLQQWGYYSESKYLQSTTSRVNVQPDLQSSFVNFYCSSTHDQGGQVNGFSCWDLAFGEPTESICSYKIYMPPFFKTTSADLSCQGITLKWRYESGAVKLESKVQFKNASDGSVTEHLMKYNFTYDSEWNSLPFFVKQQQCLSNFNDKLYSLTVPLDRFEIYYNCKRTVRYGILQILGFLWGNIQLLIAAMTGVISVYLFYTKTVTNIEEWLVEKFLQERGKGV